MPRQSFSSFLLWALLGVLFILPLTLAHAGQGHAHHNETHPTTSQAKEHEEENGVIELSQAQQQAAGITTAILKATTVSQYLTVPGTVITNLEQTSQLTPRIAAQVVKRMVNEGEHVAQSQPLVILSSVEVAKSQSELLLAYKDWMRAKELGTAVISAKEYEKHRIDYQHAVARLLAVGLTQPQIDAFLKADDPTKANGEFALLSPRAGTIAKANVIEGSWVEPGQLLYQVTDESHLWVDAQVTAAEAKQIQRGAKAIIKEGTHHLIGKVAQIHHTLNETTRTQTARIEVANLQDQLHPGQFVNCQIETKTHITSPVLSVPKQALIRSSDGDLLIYIEEKPEHFSAKEVEIVSHHGSLVVIKGLAAGSRIVNKGTFFLHSEAMKSGFNAHNH